MELKSVCSNCSLFEVQLNKHDDDDDDDDDDDVVLCHTLPVFTGLGRCPIVSWDFLLEQ